MIHEGMECLGFDDAVPVEKGVRLQRVPESLRPKINESARQRVLAPAGNELRCVTDDGRIRISMSAPGGGIHAVAFYGDFQHRQEIRIDNRPKTVRIAPEERMGFLGDEDRARMTYAPNVIRLVMHGAGPVLVHSVGGAGMRPPTADEVPAKTLLTYGTSITHGQAATMPHLSYVRQLAWRLGMDLVNLGVGGSCHCEPEFADYIAGRDDWDVAVLALSVNMIGARFTVEEFSRRVSYMVNTVAGADVKRPVVCVTIYPHWRDVDGCPAGADDAVRVLAFRESLRQAVADCPHANVTCVEGADILDDFGGLTTDLIHPGDLGMIRMGEDLAARMKPLL